MDVKQRLVSFCLFIVILVLHSLAVNAQVSGLAFRDYNGNGIRETTSPYSEPLVENVTVTAFLSDGSSFTTTTDAVGGYSFSTAQIPAGTQVRIEFSNFYPGDYSSTSGDQYGSAVQFVTASASSVDVALNNPQDYWDPSLIDDISFMIPRHNAGAYDGYLSGGLAIGRYYRTTQGVPTDANDYINISIDTIATVLEVGALWGQAYQKSEQRSFFGALGKRHAEEGPRGLDGVYIIGETAPNDYGLVGGFDMQGVVPSNGGAAIDLGSINRNHTPGDDYFIGNATQTYAIDLDAFAKVGKVGYGDLDYDEANRLLWMVNLNQRTLISIDANTPTSTLNNASSATLSALTKSYDILSLPGVPSCSSGELRPWGLGFDKGVGYLGVVCDAVYSQNFSDLAGYVLRFDPTNPSAGFTVALTVNLGGYRGWNPWVENWGQTNDYNVYDQPVLSDISFTENGSMIINIMDRWGHQMGLGQPKAISGNNDNVVAIAIGDILYACNNGSGWDMEGTIASCPQLNSITYSGEGYVGTDFEYFVDFSGDGTGEANQGASLMLPGTNNFVSIVADPIPIGGTPGEPYYATGGYYWYDHTTGDRFQWARVYPSEWQDGFGKTNGLGDIDFLAMQPQPLEIGNRIWEDTDGDGIQDPDELGIDGITVQLYEGTTLVGTMTTANGGQWYFNDTNVTGGLKPNTAYIVRVLSTSFPSGQMLTGTNTDGTTNGDVRDNDATLVSGNAEIAYTTSYYGRNDHTLDMGFRLAPCSLTDAGQANVQCNDNGTGIATDDYLTFSLNPVGANVGASYTVSTNSGTISPTSGTYGSATNFTLTDDLTGSNDIVITITDESTDCTFNLTLTNPSPCSSLPDLSLTKSVNTSIAQLGGQVTFTLTLANDNGVDATGVVVTDMLPVGVSFVSTSDPSAVYNSGTHSVVWTVGNMLGSDAPKTLQITVTTDNEGIFINNAEITSMNETDIDSTPGNDVDGEDDIDQACFSVPVTLCSDNATASISITAGTATSYQWYVSTDNGATYTTLAGETSQTLVIDNTLMGGDGVTKYFKVAYNGADITDGCGQTMCCPLIVTTAPCIVCPPPKCIIMSVTKN